MSASCPEWPAAPSWFRPNPFEGHAWLSNWVLSAIAKALLLADHTIWSGQSSIFRNRVDFGKAIGQLYAPEPVPVVMAPMFAAFERDWAVRIRYFSAPANVAVARGATGGLQRIFSVYQRMIAYSDPAYRRGRL